MAYGELPGLTTGAVFKTRLDLRLAGVHRAPQAGIVGTSKDEGAESIVLNGGYEDDLDEGDIIVYTGHGSNDPVSGKQTADQQLTKANAALAKNVLTGTPVRVIRGSRNFGSNSPEAGYRYDGLYRVEEYWQERGKSGYLIWRFRLQKVPSQEESFSKIVAEPSKRYDAQRVLTTVQRIVRSTPLGNKVKTLHEYVCQRCRRTINTPAGQYAEAAHIQPLGTPHNGPDHLDNLLCLCPNCHVEFDLGGWTIGPDLKINPGGALLNQVKEHKVGEEFLAHHRHRFGDLAD